MYSHKLKIIAVLFLIALKVLGLGDRENSETFHVVATTSIVADVVRQVGGDRVDLIQLIGHGQNPHGYEPTPREIAQVEQADLVFINGAGLEEGLADLLESVNGRKVISVSEGIELLGLEEEHDDHEDHDDHEEEDEHHHDEGDPHTWMSVANVLQWVANIEKALSEADPDNRDYYTQNGERYSQALHQLHQEITDLVDSVAIDKRVLVTDHHLLGYFIRDYQMTLAGVLASSFSTNSEVSVKELAELVSIIETRQVKAVFIDAASGSSIERIAKALNQELADPIKLVPLVVGSLEKEPEGVDTYIELMRENALRITGILNL